MSPESEIIPYLEPNSIFFPISKTTDKLVTNSRDLFIQTRSNFEYPFPANISTRERGGSFYATGDLLKLEMDLPEFPKGIEKPKIFVLGTPENEAVTLGRLDLVRENYLAFVLSRFHTGTPARTDMVLGLKQALYIKEVQDLYNYIQAPNDSFILHIAREGPLMGWETSIFQVLRRDIPYTSVKCSHQDTSDPDNAFGRIAVAYPINFEGLNPAKAKVITICDNTASGMQDVKVIEETVKYIETHNGGSNLNTLIIVSPILTEYGAITISYAAAMYNMRTVFICSGHVLGCLPPKRYYSPIQDAENLSAKPMLLKINREALGKHVEKVCVRGNWTSSFVARLSAYISSQKELVNAGTTNVELMKRSLCIDLKRLNEMGINPWGIIPYSTFDEAEVRGVDIFNLVKSSL